MVKGVNKNVIEISDTGSDYFERAILFVRSSGANADPDTMRQRAMEFLCGLKMRSWWRHGGIAVFSVLKMLCAAGAGAAVACALLLR